MSSPSRTKDLHDEHCPSLQPCMSMTPCSNALRRIVWSSPTSISMPTGSNRTTCLPAMGSLRCRAASHSRISRGCRAPRLARLSHSRTSRGCRAPHLARSSEEGEGGPRASASGPPSLSLVPPASQRAGALGVDREAAGGAAADVLGVIGLALFRRHLVEEHVRALQLGAAPQVVQRPHLLLVAQVQVRLRGHGLAVVAYVAHVRDHVGPVPAVVEGLPLPVPDEPAHVR